MRWVWLIWLLLIAASFATLEWHALSTPDGLSLSQWTVDLLYAWPLAGPLIGMGIGILLCHFFWPWTPKQKRVICGQCGRTLLIGDKK